MVRDNSEDKAERILSIYTKLTQGKVINKAQQSHLYGVSERTIQRDIVDGPEITVYGIMGVEVVNGQYSMDGYVFTN